jgi:hypothetical protein
MRVAEPVFGLGDDPVDTPANNTPLLSVSPAGESHNVCTPCRGLRLIGSTNYPLQRGAGVNRVGLAELFKAPFLLVVQMVYPVVYPVASGMDQSLGGEVSCGNATGRKLVHGELVKYLAHRFEGFIPSVGDLLNGPPSFSHD